MKVRRILDFETEDARAIIEIFESENPALHDYGLPREDWVRAIKLMKSFGFEKVLDMIDARAERLAERGDLKVCVRLRGLITAIHAMTEQELLPGDKIH